MNIETLMMLLGGSGLIWALLRYVFGMGPRRKVPRDPVTPRPLPPDIPTGVNHDQEDADLDVVNEVSGRPHSDNPVADLWNRLNRH